MKEVSGAGRCSALFAATLVVACARGVALEAKVVSMPSRAPDGAYVPERPLARARVALFCDEGASAKPMYEFASDEQGRVSARLPEPIPMDCRLELEKPGFRRRVYLVADACAYADDGGCAGLSLSARLLPERAP